MADQNRCAHRRPHAMSEEVRRALVALREKHPGWGPKKLKVVLSRTRTDVPAASTIGELLRREGLTVKRRRRRSPEPFTEPLAHAVEPNDVWSIDYKGWFRTADGRRCDPLTVSDNASRYILRVVAMPAIEQGSVWRVLDAAFREYGLPRAIRSDNGTPFASNAPGGLSKLSIWWTRLGIGHERIQPGEPQQNGRHERFHGSLQREELNWQVGRDWRHQQKLFTSYQHEFNEERPHESIVMRTPASIYRCSSRRYDGQLPEMAYDNSYYTRRVNWRGEVLWAGQRVLISEVLAGEWIGLREEDNDVFAVVFGPYLLGWIDHETGVFVREQQARRWAERLDHGGSPKVSPAEEDVGG